MHYTQVKRVVGEGTRLASRLFGRAHFDPVAQAPFYNGNKLARAGVSLAPFGTRRIPSTIQLRPGRGSRVSSVALVQQLMFLPVQNEFGASFRIDVGSPASPSICVCRTCSDQTWIEFGRGTPKCVPV